MEDISKVSPLSCSTSLPQLEYSALSSSEQEQLLHLQQSMMESIANGGDNLTIINQICSLAEQSLPNSVGTVMLLDTSTGLLNIYAAPSIPAEGAASLNGLKPGITAGSCGNAIFHKEPQFVEDTLTDPRWEDLREVAKAFNICACWSMPVMSKQGDVLGSFALSSFEHRSPSNFHHKLLEIGASVIAKMIESEKLQS